MFRSGNRNEMAMISVSDAQSVIDQCVAPLGAETVSLSDAPGRVLREPVASAEDLPPFDRSAMDGYAVRSDDSVDEFEVVGEIRAGQSIDLEIKPGKAIRILTGARLPGSGLKVIMQEHVELRDQRIRLLQKNASSNVRLRGEDARAGEILLKPGAILDATATAVLASVGKTTLLVSRRPRILHLTTGDEIVPPTQIPAAGQIRNSNASLIAGLCREQGVGGVSHFHAGDDLPQLLQTLSEADAKAHDLILISGGSGSGTYDFSAELFRHLGATIRFRDVNVRPGKPLIFGTAGAQIVIGLPGNALSHFVCFHLFVRRTLERLLERPTLNLVHGFLAEPMAETKNARETWWPARVNFREGRPECTAVAWKSSGDITRLPAANALIRVPASTSQLTEGSMVELLPTRSMVS
jgi:molybdopterin molybdotransferase